MAHHHRSTTKTIHKPFKSRHASKGALRDLAKGRMDSGSPTAVRKARHTNLLDKQARRNKAKQLRISANKAVSAERSLFAGQNGAPRIVAVVPLCGDAGTGVDGLVPGDFVVRALLSAVSTGGADELLARTRVAGAARFVRVDRFGQNVAFVVPERNMFAVLDACRVADYVLFVLSPDQPVDRAGEGMIRAIEDQGVSDTLAVVLPFEGQPPPVKERKRVEGSLHSFMTHFFPAMEKVSWLDAPQECSNLVRTVCNTMPKGVRWRRERSWMLVEDVQWPEQGAEDKGEVVLTGVVRGTPLNPDRLLQVGDWGSFQVDKVVKAPLRPVPTRVLAGVSGAAAAGAVTAEEEEPLRPTESQDDLDELAPEDLMDTEEERFDAMSAMTSRTTKGVLLDDHYYYSDEDEEETSDVRRLPRGTSKYQSAWFLDDASDGSDVEEIDFGRGSSEYGSESEGEAEDDDGGVGPSSNHNLDAMDARTVRFGGTSAPSEAGETDFGDDRAAAAQPVGADELAAARAGRKELAAAAADDADFPDELELQPNVAARERLARYRGLKSLRTSAWSTDHDRAHEPAGWGRLLEVADYGRARRRVLKKARAEQERLVSAGAGAGARVRIHLRGVPVAAARASAEATAGLVTAFSLLEHERKRTVVNVLMTLPAASPYSDGSGEPGPDGLEAGGAGGGEVEPVKAKTRLLMQCGPRRVVVEPVFSQPGVTPNDVHKADRFLQPGQTALASFVAPLTWGAVPCVFFRPAAAAAGGDGAAAGLVDAAAPVEYLCHGTTEPPSTGRVVAKRILLTGHPYKVHKRVVTVRYMFFSAEDVAWYKAIPLRTIRGRTGFIKESLGTHGYFKATFDGPINPLDAIGMSLYKRVWPREATMWQRPVVTELVSRKGKEKAEEWAGSVDVEMA